MPSPSFSPRLRAGLAAGALGLAAAATSFAVPATAATAATSKSPTNVLIRSAAAAQGGDNLGVADGAIKHVWLIILENKSYDATFTGLNKNSYLWQTLPKQGVLLKNYYGTGHFSQDNYESMVSGQAPEQDTQSDCDVAATDFSSNAAIADGGSNGIINSPATSANYGQAVSSQGANGADGKNGCVYPTSTPTLFNQLDAAGKTWKGYAQDLGDQNGREDGACGYPGTSNNMATGTVDSTATSNTAYSTATPPPAHNNSTALNAPKAYKGVVSFTGTQAAGTDANGAAAAEDGYVAKHFPFPWFHSQLDGTMTTPANGGTDCDNNHIANLDGPASATTKYQGTGLYTDLQSEATTPAFSWITPNNCSDAHDAVCKGNNLSGAFNADGSPNYQTGGSKPFDPQGTTPKNYTGGLYASDLFLKWYIPLIEQSPAFADGGLIDVTFDEANPAFTYTGNSFNNANDPAYAPSKVSPGVSDQPNATTGLAADAAGQNINGQNINTEPAGPNTPLTYQADGVTPNPGPGDNGFIDRTAAGPRSDSGATAVAGTSTISDNAARATDPGRSVSGTGIPANAFVGPESNVGPNLIATNAGSVTTGSFTLVDANGNPVNTTGPVSGITMGAQSSDQTASNYDPLFDNTDFTPGGGDTGSVLISPFIKPGTSSTKYYNHYSWLRTMEDIFDVSQGSNTTALPAGSVSAGLDGTGHLGYASQAGLRPFSTDVFNNPAGTTPSPVPPASLPEAGLAIGLPLAALALGGAFVIRRRRAGQTAGSTIS